MVNKGNKNKVSNLVLIILNLLDIMHPDDFQIKVISSLIGHNANVATQKLKNSGLFI